MTVHLIWLWSCFFFGAATYMLKRAFESVKGPQPVVSNFTEFIKIAGVPLFFRLVVDSGFYWLAFSPELAQAFLKFVGWESFAGVVGVLTHFAVAALFFGLTIDALTEWFIPIIVKKIPFLKEWWPKYPTAAQVKEITNA